MKIKTCAEVCENKDSFAATCLHVGQVDEAAEGGEVVVLQVHIAHVPKVVHWNQIHSPELESKHSHYFNGTG